MTGSIEENHTHTSGLWRWLGQGARSAVFLRPDLAGLQAGPLALLALVAVLVGLGMLLQWSGIDGPAVFEWQAIASGWLTTLLPAAQTPMRANKTAIVARVAEVLCRTRRQ